MAEPRPDLLIRAAVPADAEAIHQAVLKLAAHVGALDKVKSSPDDFRRHGFGADPAFQCLMAEIGGAFAGICLFFRSFSTFTGGPGVYVQDLIVEQKFRGAGVGEALLREAARISRDAGGTYLRLAVDIGNPNAARFYQRLGLRHVDDDLIHAAYGKAFEALCAG
jgi:ribosomal protein S18 acetylase RimI-like enzyme